MEGNMQNGLCEFISETSLKEHEEYLAMLKCKASVYKKSGIDVFSGAHINIRPSCTDAERKKIVRLAEEIVFHDVYFSSFGKTFAPSFKVRESFGSENNFAYEITRFAEDLSDGFICIYTDKVGRVGFSHSSRLPKGVNLRLAIDLCEHAYFRDYGFKRERYLRAALEHLDFGRLSAS